MATRTLSRPAGTAHCKPGPEQVGAKIGLPCKAAAIGVFIEPERGAGGVTEKGIGLAGGHRVERFKFAAIEDDLARPSVRWASSA